MSSKYIDYKFGKRIKSFTRNQALAMLQCGYTTTPFLGTYVGTAYLLSRIYLAPQTHKAGLLRPRRFLQAIIRNWEIVLGNGVQWRGEELLCWTC